MTRRILINLIVFATIGVIMTIWAFENVIRFDFIERPYPITVEFASSPGLHPNFEVDYLGLKIGKIDSVRLSGSKVLVKLDIDQGNKIPEGVHAAAARKSAVGEPVVELTPAPGQGNAPAMRPGSVIPLSRTSTPPKYGDLFAAVNKLIGAVDPKAAGTLAHELALGWSGREDSLRQIVESSDQFTQTFADNSEMLDGLTKDLTKITHVLAQNRDSFGQGVDNLAALTGALRQVRAQLTQLRDQGPDLLNRVNSLVDATGPDVDCTLGTLGTFVPSLTTTANMRNLRNTLAQSPQLVQVLDGILGLDQGKPVLNVVFVLTTKKLSALEYRYPLGQPTVSKIGTCPDGRTPGVVKQKQFFGGKQGETFPTHDPALDKPKATGVQNAGDQSGTGVPGWLIWIPPLIALAVLVRVMAGAVPVLSRRMPGISRFRRRKD